MKRRFILMAVEGDRDCRVEVDLVVHPYFQQTIGLSTPELLKHRLFDAYCALQHEFEPGGPPLAPELSGL